jgi:hypothetical protein
MMSNTVLEHLAPKQVLLKIKAFFQEESLSASRLHRVME